MRQFLCALVVLGTVAAAPLPQDLYAAHPTGAAPGYAATTPGGGYGAPPAGASPGVGFREAVAGTTPRTGYGAPLVEEPIGPLGSLAPLGPLGAAPPATGRYNGLGTGSTGRYAGLGAGGPAGLGAGGPAVGPAGRYTGGSGPGRALFGAAFRGPAGPGRLPPPPRHDPFINQGNPPNLLPNGFVDGPSRPYSFAYAVDEPEYGNHYGHSEESDGVVTQGEYRVLLPDGRTQIVTYHVEGDSGFQATVRYEGEAVVPPPGAPGGPRLPGPPRGPFGGPGPLGALGPRPYGAGAAAGRPLINDDVAATQDSPAVPTTSYGYN